MGGIETKNTGNEQSPADPVSGAIEKLRMSVKPADVVDGLKKEDLTTLADRIASELSAKRLTLSKEKRENLTLAVKLEALELRLQETEVAVLEQRYKTLEGMMVEPQSRVPQFLQPVMASAKGFFEGMFNGSKTMLAGLGGMLGITVPEKASDAWAYIRPRGKKFFMGFLANALGFIPGVSEWAKRQTDTEDAWNAIQLATKDTKGVELQMNPNELKNIAKWLPWQTYLNAFSGGNTIEKVLQYVSLYIAQERKAHPTETIVVSTDRLIDAALTPATSVKAVAPVAPQAPATPPTVPAGGQKAS